MDRTSKILLSLAGLASLYTLAAASIFGVL